MIAFISDLHSNEEALATALKDAEAEGAEAVICLGDVLGYGASPRAVVDRTRKECALCLQGNHDAALLSDEDARGFNERALAAIRWTQAALNPELEENWPIWDWLGELVPSMAMSVDGVGEEVLLVHASPREPLNEYLMPGAGKHPERLRANFEAARHRLTFFGHTHHPGYFAEGDDFVRAVEAGNRLEFEPDRRYLVNVGSVGQPRDGDPRLAYALFDGETLRWRRLEYDVDSAVKRIEAVPELPDSLAARLRVGR